MLTTYCSFAQYIAPKEGLDYIDDCLAYLHNDRLKGEYVINKDFQRYKSYDQYLNGVEKYGKYFVTPSLKARAEAVGTKLYDTRAGGIAADFTYPDVNGKMVSLSDFKGKVVLVDVWATWCGPCRGEIPHLKKLEEEMHGKDVVFLGVSVDEVKDKQKWLDFIEKEDSDADIACSARSFWHCRQARFMALNQSKQPASGTCIWSTFFLQKPPLAKSTRLLPNPSKELGLRHRVGQIPSGFAYDSEKTSNSSKNEFACPHLAQTSS